MVEKEKKSDKELQIRLRTELKEYSVDKTPFSVPADIEPQGLNKLVKGLLSHLVGNEVPEFDWICCNEFIRGKLSEHLSDRDDISTETILELEFVEKTQAPKPEKSANHDDWVSAVRLNGDLILTGCYDNSVNIWTTDGQKLLVLPNHEGPVKCVDWIEVTESGGVFVSGSHDQHLNIYTWNRNTNSIDNLNTCKGHERSVECVSVNPRRKVFVSGSFDNTLKIWGATPSDQDDTADGESTAKRPRAGQSSKKAVTRTPIQTLGGHKDAVSGVAWTPADEIVSGSWDHTIKIWELELGGLKSEIVTNKAVFSVAVGGESGELILAGGAERSVRLYDPRSGHDVKAAFTAHQGLVTSVTWSSLSRLQFASASQDNTVRLWDTRSSRTPIYELSGHEDQVMSCHWMGTLLASGGADNQLKIYSTNQLTSKDIIIES